MPEPEPELEPGPEPEPEPEPDPEPDPKPEPEPEPEPKPEPGNKKMLIAGKSLFISLSKAQKILPLLQIFRLKFYYGGLREILFFSFNKCLEKYHWH